MRVAPQIPVPPGGNDEVYLRELQTALDQVRGFAEANIGKAGSAEFPFERH